MLSNHAEFVPVLKALSDETRLKIVDMLSCGEMCACKILEQFSITQPTLSYHMKILTECGIVTGRRDGAWMHYSIDKQRGDAMLSFLNHVLNEKEDCICRLCTKK